MQNPPAVHHLIQSESQSLYKAIQCLLWPKLFALVPLHPHVPMPLTCFWLPSSHSGSLLFLKNRKHAFTSWYAPAPSVWNFLFKHQHNFLPLLLLGFCSNVTSLEEPLLTTLKCYNSIPSLLLYINLSPQYLSLSITLCFYQFIGLLYEFIHSIKEELCCVQCYILRLVHHIS